MKTRQLGKTSLHITPIGLGAWAIGGGNWAFGWGEQDDHESIAAIRRGLDLGINWIDTAAAYGLGHSEEIVARALQGRAERPYIFTKCSLVWNKGETHVTNSLAAASIRREIEGSLRRLNVEVIDLYQIHWPLPDEDLEEGWSTLAALKQEGKVRAVGLSNCNVNQMRRAIAIAPIDACQPPYSVVKREAEQDVLPFCHEHDIGLIVYSPMQSGLLTGKMSRERVARLPESDWRVHDEEFQEPRLSRNLAVADKLRDIAALYNRSPAEAAIAWTLTNPVVTGAIVGVRNPGQVDVIVGAAEFRLTNLELSEIDDFLKARA